MLNLAKSLQASGHSVTFFTTSMDLENCFPEVLDETVKVEVLPANLIPHAIFGRFVLLMKVIRLIFVTLQILFTKPKFDLFVVDVNHNILPLLWLFQKKTIFYLHYPVKLFCNDRKGVLKKAYYKFLDFTEEISLLFASKILVNSKNTQQITYDTFPIIKELQKPLEVLYPSIDFCQFDSKAAQKKFIRESIPQLIGDDAELLPYFFSLNRFERRKNVILAIKAFAEYKRKNADCRAKLVIAGNYIPTNVEDPICLSELEETADQLGVFSETLILKNIPHNLRVSLLKFSLAVLYTPMFEHFGIVPVEAMYLGRPVIAHRSGGPLESVSQDGGFLLENDPVHWMEKMEFLAANKEKADEMGTRARENVKRKFSYFAFSQQITDAANAIFK